MSHDINIPSSSATSCRYLVRWVTLLLGLPMCVFMSTCDRGRQKTVQSSAVKAILVAEPNPVPAGDLNQPAASTVVTWNTGNGTTGYLYVKVDREPETFVTQ